MLVFKIEKAKKFTILSNYHLRDRKLSFKENRLLPSILSLSLDWDYS